VLVILFFPQINADIRGLDMKTFRRVFSDPRLSAFIRG
jgi:hypothetical protein